MFLALVRVRHPVLDGRRGLLTRSRRWAGVTWTSGVGHGHGPPLDLGDDRPHLLAEGGHQVLLDDKDGRVKRGLHGARARGRRGDLMVGAG